MERLLVAALVVTALGLAQPTAASAAGGPLIPRVGSGFEGLVTRDGEHRFVLFGAGNETLLVRIGTDGGEIERLRYLPGQLGLPSVTLAGAPGGLSRDASTLVLGRIDYSFRFPQRRTTFTMVDLDRLTERRLKPDRVTLPGHFSFDAISPDGSRIYLVEYLSSRDLTRYAVRVLDAESGRLEPEPIVDPDDAAGEMRGYPLARASRPDGRWAYTLYDGDEHAFVHALDTVEGEAVCIDLEGLKILDRQLFSGRFVLETSEGGDELTVLRKGDPVATIDTASFDVREPEVTQASSVAASTDGGLDAVAVLLAGVGLAGAAALAGSWLRRVK